MSIGDFFKRLFSNLDRPPTQPTYNKDEQLEKAKASAGVVDEFIDNLNSPAELMERVNFKLGVTALNVPCFSSEELLNLSDDPSKAIWQMGVIAVSGREPDPELVELLFRRFEDGGPWHQYMVLQALMVHAPLETSLAGEMIFRFREHRGGLLDHVLKMITPFVKRRCEAGERPSFGEIMNRMNPERADDIQVILDVALETALKDEVQLLRAELDQWRASFVNLDTLKTIGRFWNAEKDTGPLVVDHPQFTEKVEDVLRSLNQSPRRSVLLTGEHGVGKTSVMRKVAKELMNQGWMIFEATGNDILAGQKYIGELEQRVKDLLDQISGGRKVLWYVPSFQALGWVGTHQFSRSSVLDLIFPHLESGQITIVGELSVAAYQQLLQDQPRLVTACEICQIEPLDEASTLELAASWASRISAVEEGDGPELIPEATLQEAWMLARQYLRDRESPGCLMELLAQTLKQMLMEATESDQVTRDDLIRTLAGMTSLPRQMLDEREALDPDDLRAFFNQRILGQAEAVGCLIERITLIKAGLTDPSRPQGVFLFAGPTGTGKTEIAKALAMFLFGSEERLLRYDMSEFQSPESLERLMGDGQNLDRESLTLKIRKQPFSVILLDEFEKAHPKVWDIFLQVFDDGRLTDPMGRTSDFRHAIIILTSNLGGQAATDKGLGFGQDGQGFRATDVDRAVERTFRPEFLNRLDRVVIFRPFAREVMREILDKELRDIQQRRGLRNRSWDVVWEDSALEFLLDKGFSPTLGARPLKRAIERYLLTPLAGTIVKGQFPAGDQFLYIQAKDDQLITEFIGLEASDDLSDDIPEILEENPCAETGAGSARCLAAIALNPSGNHAEVENLDHHWQQLRQRLESPAWTEAKTLALSMISLPDFWSSTERFAVLGEVEYRERVETGLETVGSLIARIAPRRSGSAKHYPRKLIGQAAERLHLLNLACKSLDNRLPWETFIHVEGKDGHGSDDAGPWVERLGGMYRQWGGQRKMRIKVLAETPGKPGQGRSLLLSVSGYAAHAILESEIGLHIWEQPDPNRDNATTQSKAMVRVAPMPDDRVAESDDELLAVAREILAEPMPGAPAVVRNYRELPDPLVKDRGRGWRSGRLDRVLGGDFDLLGACADHEALEGQG